MRKLVGERVKELREAKGWKQSQLARRLKVSRPTVTQWENGTTKNIRDANLIALAEVFGVSTDHLLTGTTASMVKEEQGAYGARP